MNCSKCGRKSGWAKLIPNVYPFYSCLAPSCGYRGIPVCYPCLERNGVKVNFLKIPVECPFCNIGKLESLGT